MSKEELAVVRQILQTNNPLSGKDIPTMRASMDAATAAAPRPEDVRYEPVDAGGVPAEWTIAPESRDERSIVYFHGGGYAIGSIESHRGLVTRLARAAKARVLSVDYRLGPEHPYPAAVEDGVAAFDFVASQGTSPSSIALAGDSAGGGLTAATLVALRDQGKPLPAAAACISPWLDLTLSGDSVKTKADEDPLVEEGMLRMMADAYIGPGDAKSPTASPLFADLTGLPPTLVQVGSAEILLDDSTRFAECAGRAGVELELRIWPDMIHVWHAFADLLSEGREAIEEIAVFLEPRLS